MASTKMFTKNHHPPNTSSTAFFHQQQQGSSTNQYIDEDTTLTQEMHVKMAKKIAQLTKVSIFKKKTFLYLLFANKRAEKEKNEHHVFDKQYTSCSTIKKREKKRLRTKIVHILFNF
jgi:BRCT domain type II-containing protein